MIVQDVGGDRRVMDNSDNENNFGRGSTMAIVDILPGAEQLPLPAITSAGSEYMPSNTKIVGVYLYQGSLFVELEGDTVGDLLDTEARKLAYSARDTYGFGNAGIENYGGSYPYGSKYRQLFRLTRGIV